MDFESYYDKECSIKTLGPLGYFSHPQFDAYMVSVVGDNGYKFVGSPKDFDWSLLAGEIVLSHNASFDETLYLYGVSQRWWAEVQPKAWHCTADMAAACGYGRSLQAAAAQILELEITKDTRNNMAGKRWEDMTDEFRKEVSAYALKDSELCLQIWQQCSDQWPERERAISHLNRRIVQRGIPMNVGLLREQNEELSKRLFEAESAIPWAGDQPLLSRKAFDEECRKHGIEPPKSLSAADVDATDWLRRHGTKHRWVEAVTSWRRINALKKKVESFDYATMADDRYYGGLMYWGGHTGRFSGSGGNLNLQNLPRNEMFGVNLRHLIAAPEGKRLVVVDLSQIEVRTLCWLAGDTETLQLIKECDDFYTAFAIKFGLWTKEQGSLKDKDPALRHRVKAMVLGCFGPDTKVLTDRGWVAIVNVRATDKVWDGTQWTSHEGLLHQGVQETITNHGLEATPDHEILTEHGWREWGDLQQSDEDLKSALRTATLPSSAMNDIPAVNGGVGTLSSAASVGGKGWWTELICNLGKPLAAMFAPKRRLHEQLCAASDTPRLFPTRPTEPACLTASAPSTIGATTRTIRAMGDMVGGAFGSSSRGSITDLRSSSIWSLLKGGISRIWSWIGSTTTRDMHQRTCGFRREERTATTSGRSRRFSGGSQSLKRKSDVYDLKNCGPNNRFTVLTDHGPLVVHNCGYGCGAPKFAMISGMSEKEAVEAVQLYRSALKKVPALWREYNTAVQTSYDLGVPFAIELPSGRSLNYGKLKMSEYNGRMQHVGIINRFGKRTPMKLWGGIIAENCSQALARDIFCDTMLRIDAAGINIILHVHDEVVIECPEEDAEQILDTTRAIMSTPPEWISDIPLAAEGEILTHYQK